MGSGSVVRLIGIGSVSGLNSFIGKGEDDILSLGEKSSGSASGDWSWTGHHDIWLPSRRRRWLLERNRSHRLWIWIWNRGLLHPLSRTGWTEINRVGLRLTRAVNAAYPATFLRRAVSFSTVGATGLDSDSMSQLAASESESSLICL